MARLVEREPEVFELMEEQVCGPSRAEQSSLLYIRVRLMVLPAAAAAARARAAA